MQPRLNNLDKQELINLVNALLERDKAKNKVDAHQWDDAFCGVSDTFMNEHHKLVVEYKTTCKIVSDIIDPMR